MIIEIITWILVFLVVTTIAWVPYYKWRDRQIPTLQGPYALPYLGTLLHFRDVKNIFNTMKTFHDIYGFSYRGYFLNKLYIYTIDMGLVELAMTSNKTIDKGYIYHYLNNWLRTGLLTSGGEKWRLRRKMITPAYHFKVLDQFIETFDKNANIMIEKLRREVNEPQTDIFPYVNLCALDVICETAMGTKVNAQLQSESKFVKATKEINRIIMCRCCNLIQFMDWSYRFTQDYHKEKVVLKVLHEYTMNMIKARRDTLIRQKVLGNQNKNVRTEKKNNQIEDNFDILNKRKDNFLDLLLKSSINGKPLSNHDIQEEVDTFMFEGHDTVSAAISFALFLISNHQDVQDQLIAEQRDIFGSNPDTPTSINDLQNMKYLEIVIKETLRLYPSVPIIIREVTEDLTYNNLKLIKGSQIVIFIYELHRNPEFFPEPEQFRPERFLPEHGFGRNPFAYLPFSGGHRNCIGQKFAMLEMKSIISKIIRHYKLLPLVTKHEPFILSEIILRSKNGLLVKVQNRER